MVRWLVEKEQIRFRDQQTREVGSHYPSAAHGLGLTSIICFTKAQTSQDAFGFSFYLLLIRGKRSLVVKHFVVFQRCGSRHVGRQLDDRFFLNRCAFLRKKPDFYSTLKGHFTGISLFLF